MHSYKLMSYNSALGHPLATLFAAQLVAYLDIVKENLGLYPDHNIRLNEPYQVVGRASKSL
jgi:hypothetical protein